MGQTNEKARIKRTILSILKWGIKRSELVGLLMLLGVVMGGTKIVQADSTDTAKLVQILSPENRVVKRLSSGWAQSNYVMRAVPQLVSVEANGVDNESHLSNKTTLIRVVFDGELTLHSFFWGPNMSQGTLSITDENGKDVGTPISSAVGASERSVLSWGKFFSHRQSYLKFNYSHPIDIAVNFTNNDVNKKLYIAIKLNTLTVTSGKTNQVDSFACFSPDDQKATLKPRITSSLRVDDTEITGIADHPGDRIGCDLYGIQDVFSNPKTGRFKLSFSRGTIADLSQVTIIERGVDGHVGSDTQRVHNPFHMTPNPARAMITAAEKVTLNRLLDAHKSDEKKDNDINTFFKLIQQKANIVVKDDSQNKTTWRLQTNEPIENLQEKLTTLDAKHPVVIKMFEVQDGTNDDENVIHSDEVPVTLSITDQVKWVLPRDTTLPFGLIPISLHSKLYAPKLVAPILVHHADGDFNWHVTVKLFNDANVNHQLVNTPQLMYRAVSGTPAVKMVPNKSIDVTPIKRSGNETSMIADWYQTGNNDYDKGIFLRASPNVSEGNYQWHLKWELETISRDMRNK